MATHPEIEEIRDAISKGRLKVAFKKVNRVFQFIQEKSIKDDTCDYLRNSFRLLSGQFHFNEENGILQLSKEAYTTINRNKISKGLLEMSDQLEEAIKRHHSATNNNGQKEHLTVKGGGKVLIEFNLHDKNLEDFSEEDKEAFLEAISKMLKISNAEIKITNTKSGSVKITIALDSYHLELLEKLIERGALAEWGKISLHSTLITDQLFQEFSRFEVQYGLSENGKLDLQGVDLKGANLTSTDLIGAELKVANLARTDLRGADLKKARLAWANLDRVDLMQAILSGADLSEANLNEALLTLANLEDADLIDADLRAADLSGANLNEADLSGANLTEADLSKANLSWAYLMDANLSSSQLTEANLSGSYLMEADLRNADLIEADLRKAYLLGANLNGAKLSRAKIDGAYIHTTQRSFLKDFGLDTTKVNFIDREGPSVNEEVEVIV